MRILLTLVLLNSLFLTLYAQNTMLCVGRHWSEDEANLKMKSFDATWNDKVSWEKRANNIKANIIEGMQLDKMPHISGDFKAIIRGKKWMDIL